MSETRTLSNLLGKRCQPATDDIVSSKHSALPYVEPSPVISDDWAHDITVSPTNCSSQPELQEFNSMSYSLDESPPHVTVPQQSLMESQRLEIAQPSQSDWLADMSQTVSSPTVATLAASLPSASHMFQLIQSQTSAAATAGPLQLATEASVHPLLSMVQQVIPPLQDYSPPLLPSHVSYPYHVSPQPSHQPVQTSHHAVDHSVTNVPVMLTRTVSSSTRGTTSHAKLQPPTPKVIIVSGTGISSATTIAGPPPPVVTTTVLTKPTPGQLCCFH